MTATGQPSAAAYPAGWYPDTLRRHELRYWDGQAWTEHVADQGQASIDPIAAAPTTPIVNAAATAQPAVAAPQAAAWTGRINPETPVLLFAVYNGPLGPPPHEKHWRDVPEHLRGVFEAAMLDDEWPVACAANKGQLLLTDQALLVGDKSGCVVLIPRRSTTAQRFALTDITDVDEKGFTFRGAHMKMHWHKGDEDELDDGFFALFMRLHPECAPRTVVQESERFDPTSRHVPIEIRHLVGGQSSDYLAAGTTNIETQWATTNAEAILRPAGAGATSDYFQFVACPACGEWLRLRAHRNELTLCNPGLTNLSGGTYAMVFARHVIQRL